MLSARLVLASLAAASLAASAVVVAACGSDESTGYAPYADASADGTNDSDSSTFPSSDAAAPIEANGIVLVHAASFPAFRLCFSSLGGAQPIPSKDLMPESNLPGVDVGSVVRIDPLAKPPGKITAFAVDDIKAVYPPGKNGPTCGELVSGALSPLGVTVGIINDDLSTGIHLLVLRGSKEDQSLVIQPITLLAYPRPRETTIPVQVVPLSSDVGLRELAVAFGDLAGDAGDAGDGGAAGEAGASVTFVRGVIPFGTTTPSAPYPLVYDPSDEGAYATRGFTVSRGAPDGGDAGLEVVLAQSLADVQRFSASRALPDEYFAAASSYVLLLLGGVDADASDERARLHFLALPLLAPVSDAGPSDASLD